MNLFKTIKPNKSGSSLLEIIVTLGFLVLFLVVVGKTIFLIDKMNDDSELRAMAVNFAKLNAEIVLHEKDNFFLCDCSIDSCVPNTTCTRTSSDNETCVKFKDYDYCWTNYPINLAPENNFYLNYTGGVYSLVPSGGTPQIVPEDSRFKYEINISSVNRDALGDISETGTVDSNTKMIEVKVWYGEGFSSNIKVNNLITAWKIL